MSDKYKIHSGTFTITNKQTGDYKTFRIQKEQKADSKFFPGKRIVGLLTGPDNYRDFVSFGTIGEDGRVVPFNKYLKTNFQKFCSMLNLFLGNFPEAAQECESFKLVEPEKYEVKESRACRRCGRLLTTPEAIAKGIGSECEKKV